MPIPLPQASILIVLQEAERLREQCGRSYGAQEDAHYATRKEDRPTLPVRA